MTRPGAGSLQWLIVVFGIVVAGKLALRLVPGVDVDEQRLFDMLVICENLHPLTHLVGL